MPPPPLVSSSPPHLNTLWWSVFGFNVVGLCVCVDLTTGQAVSPHVLEFLGRLREVVTIGIVGGSDLVKAKEQLGEDGAWPLAPWPWLCGGV